MRKQIEKVKSSIAYDESTLTSAEKTNNELRKAQEKYEECREARDQINAYHRKMSLLYNICNKKASEFTEGRVKLIEQTVEDNLMYIFPEEKFKVKLDLDVSKNGRETCQLLLGKSTPRGIEYAPTTAQNGRFVRQLISVVVIYTINYLRGCDMIYMDEALASSDKYNLTKLKPLLDKMRESGMQVVLIEHKPELYNNVTRRQFTLSKNRSTSVTTIIAQEDIKETDNE